MVGNGEFLIGERPTETPTPAITDRFVEFSQHFNILLTRINIPDFDNATPKRFSRNLHRTG